MAVDGKDKGGNATVYSLIQFVIRAFVLQCEKLVQTNKLMVMVY